MRYHAGGERGSGLGKQIMYLTLIVYVLSMHPNKVYNYYVYVCVCDNFVIV